MDSATLKIVLRGYGPSHQPSEKIMFLTLLVATLLIAAVVCFSVSALFAKPIDGILEKIVAHDIAYAWTKYMKFAIYVVGISGGVNMYKLEDYLRPADENFTPPDLTQERWVLEVYRTVIESLQSIAWLLLVFFVFALIAYVIVRAFEQRSPGQSDTGNDS
jgi:ABC-type transport system involved in multi-copper enzyme maturation permease subunit